MEILWISKHWGRWRHSGVLYHNDRTKERVLALSAIGPCGIRSYKDVQKHFVCDKRVKKWLVSIPIACIRCQLVPPLKGRRGLCVCTAKFSTGSRIMMRVNLRAHRWNHCGAFYYPQMVSSDSRSGSGILSEGRMPGRGSDWGMYSRKNSFAKTVSQGEWN